MDNIKTQKEKENEAKIAEELKHIEAWKIKRMIKKLENSKGNGTSMISLSIPADKQISQITKMLNEEYGAAANIKSSKTRSSVQTAITSTRERLKLYNRTPKNGLIVFCGIILLEDGKTEKKINIDFEPFKPVTSSKYFCDDAFHPDLLMYLLDDDEKFGFIIVDGSGVLYATLQGNTREIL
jgi:peptide chain release factor subunit 1